MKALKISSAIEGGREGKAVFVYALHPGMFVCKYILASNRVLKPPSYMVS